jgi:uncharacterized membrane protein YccC
MKSWFDLPPGRIRFGLLTAFSAWAAVALAMSLDVPNAHWAGITVFTVAQPTRELLFRKAFWRIVGTLAGAGMGVLMLATMHKHPYELLAALTLWMALCSGASGLVRHFRSYVFVLAGYTCSIVALVDVQHPELVAHIAYGRIACTLLGVLVVTTLTGLFMPTEVGDADRRRLRQLVREATQWARMQFDASARKDSAAPILAALADCNEWIDERSGRTEALRRRNRAGRRVLSACLMLIALVRLKARSSGGPAASDEALASLRRVEDGIDGDTKSKTPDAHPRGDHELDVACRNLFDAWSALSADRAVPEDGERRSMNPDWRNVARASARTAICVSASALPWLATGWAGGPYMLLGACIYITLFSTNENGKPFVRLVLPGVLLGLAFGILFRGYLVPFPHEPLAVLLGLIPFLLLSGLGLAIPATAVSAVEYNNYFLMMVQPAQNLGEAVGLHEVALGLSAGVIVAIVSLHSVLPHDSRRRHRVLTRLLMGDIERLARADPRADTRAMEARAAERFLRMMARPDPRDRSDVHDLASMLLDLLQLLVSIRARAAEGLALQPALTAISCLRVAPDHAAQTLRAAAELCRKNDHWLAHEMCSTAALIEQRGSNLFVGV